MSQQALETLDHQPLGQREIAAATRLAEQARALDRGNGQALFVLGIIALEQHRSTEAVAFLRDSIAREPENPTARPFLAEILLSLGEPAEAQRLLEEHLQFLPGDLEAAYLLAESLRQQDAPELARGRLEAILDVRPDHRDARFALAQMAAEAGDLAAAIQQAEKLVQRDPRDRQARALLQRARRQRQSLGSVSSIDAPAGGRPDRAQRVPIHFSEVAQSIGVRFHHTNGASRHRYLPELLGGGVALLDYDGDGWLDIYFANGTVLPVGSDSQRPGNVFFRNRGDGTFEDRTAESGLGHRGFSTGLSVGDYDNDGDPDVYVTGYGPNVLFQNNGDGRFRDVTRDAQVGDTGMGTGAAWLDADEDGDLDLYVVNYARYDVTDPVPCTDPAVGNVYCGVQLLTAAADVLYVNQGDGTFTKGTYQAGLARNDGKGMGVAAADFNGDGHVDLFVANDTSPNFVFLGQDGLLFDDVTRVSGAATDRDDEQQGSMGVAVGDLNGDGLPEVFITNYWMEHNTLYRNSGGLFTDVTDRAGVGLRSRRAVGWGTVLADFNRDIDLDLFVANGHFYDWRGPREPLEQLPELWMGTPSHRAAVTVETNLSAAGHNARRGATAATPRFRDAGTQAGPYFTQPAVGRGAADGDLDNDGDVDLVISHWGRPAAVLRNDTADDHAWVSLELVGVTGNRDAIGAAVTIDVRARRLHRQRIGGGSYLSSNDHRMLIGLGNAERVVRLRIRWPSGLVQQWDSLRVGRSYVVVEGEPELRAGR